MTTVWIVLAVALEAYLLGSVDTGIIVSNCIYHDDVRSHGSGGAGMTNMLRTFGKKAAAMTAFGDVLKGILAVSLARWLFGSFPPEGVSLYLGAYLAAVFAVIGHLKPLYFGFKGGKGVLVATGAILAIQPVLIPILFVIFILVFLFSRMVSLGSVTVAVLYPVLTLCYGVFFQKLAPSDLAVTGVGALIMGVMVVYMHRSNIKRILSGTEYRFDGSHKSK